MGNVGPLKTNAGRTILDIKEMEDFLKILCFILQWEKRMTINGKLSKSRNKTLVFIPWLECKCEKLKP